MAFGILALLAIERALEDEALDGRTQRLFALGGCETGLEFDGDLLITGLQFRGRGEIDAAALVPTEFGFC